MNTREIAEEFRLGHWAQIMQERVDSGQSIRAYCREKGIGTNVYFYWQKKLREAAAQQIAVAAEQEKGQQALVPSGWATSEEFEVLIGSARLTQKLRRQEIMGGQDFAMGCALTSPPQQAASFLATRSSLFTAYGLTDTCS